MPRKTMLIMVAASLFANQHTEPKIMDVKQQVWQAVRAWNIAFEKNDAEGFFRYMHDEVSLFVPSCPYRIEGKEPDRKGYDHGLGHGHSRVAFFQEMQPVIQVFGDTALVTYHTRGWYGQPGSEQQVTMKETNVLVRTNGEWQVVHVHLSK